MTEHRTLDRKPSAIITNAFSELCTFKIIFGSNIQMDMYAKRALAKLAHITGHRPGSATGGRHLFSVGAVVLCQSRWTLCAICVCGVRSQSRSSRSLQAYLHMLLIYLYRLPSLPPHKYTATSISPLKCATPHRPTHFPPAGTS